MAELIGGGDPLAVFLREEAHRRFDWTGANCLLLPADWIVRLGLPDPAAGWRDLEDEGAVARLVDRYGSLAGFAEAAMAGHARVDVTNGVRRGDVGVVAANAPEGSVQVGAICVGARWVGRSPGGLWVARARPLVAWRAGEI